MAIWGDFQGITVVTRERMGFKKLQHWVDVFYGWIFNAVKNNRPSNSKFLSDWSLFIQILRNRKLKRIITITSSKI